MVATSFELGGSDFTEKNFDAILTDNQEKLIKFFGEQYREDITKKIAESTFIIVHRYFYDAEAKNKLNKLYEDFILENFGSLEAINNAYYPNRQLTQDQVFEVIELAIQSGQINEDIVNILIAQITKGKSLPEEAKKVLYDTFIAGDKWQTGLKLLASDYSKFALQRTLLEEQIKKQNYYDRKYSLSEQQDIVRTCMEQVFGGSVADIDYDPEDDISKIYLQYLNNSEELSLSYIQKFGEVFSQIINQNLQFGDLLEDEDFLKKLNKLNALIEKQLKKLAEKESINGEILRAPVSAVADYLEDFNIYNWKDSFRTISKFVTHVFDWGAYCQDMVDLQTKKHSSLVVVPADLFGLTHEMIHATSSTGRSYYSYITGFSLNGQHTAFNEVITELFNFIVNDYDLSTYKDGPLNSYTAAFPILQNFILDNLENFKNWYITNDTKSVSEFMGEEFEDLCCLLQNLLKLAEDKGYNAQSVQNYLANPRQCEDKDLLNLLRDCSVVMANIENHANFYNM